MICPIVILAAGGSPRMAGRDKLLETIDGVPLIRQQCLRARATTQPVYVCVPSRDHPRARAIADLDVQIVAVPNAASGISESIKAALAVLLDSPAFMVVLADLVALQTRDLAAVLDAWAHHPQAQIWRGATFYGTPGHPVIFDAALRPEFANLSGDQGAAPIIAAHHDRVHLVPLGPQALLDLDTPDDWANWRARL